VVVGRPSQRGRGLDGRAGEDPPGRGRPRIDDPPGQDDRPDHPVLGPQRFRERVPQPVRGAGTGCQALGDPVRGGGGAGARDRPRPVVVGLGRRTRRAREPTDAVANREGDRRATDRGRRRRRRGGHRDGREVEGQLLLADRHGHRLALARAALDRQGIVEVGKREQRGRARHARSRADEGRLQPRGVRPATHDDDVVRVRPDPELLDDGGDDRVGRDRAGQALEDPRQALCLGAPPDLELVHGVPVVDGREADDHDEPDEGEVDRGRIRRQPQQDQQAEDEERSGEQPP
jgi:hypothetical protein